MAERTTARRSTVGTTRGENRRRTSSAAEVRASTVPTSTRVGAFAVMRRMFQRARQSRQAVHDTGPRSNRKRVSAPERPGIRQRLSGLQVDFARPVGVAKRVGAMAAKGFLVVAIAAAVVAVGRLVEAHVRKSDAFATKTIDVQGNSRLDRETILTVASLAIGKNTFAVSPEEAEAALLKNPWIASAHVVRRLPDSYSISVEERQAVAILTLGEPYLVAGDASVFKRWEVGDPDELPLITGVEPSDFADDVAYRTSLLVNSVALLHDYRDAGLWRRAPIQEIHMENDEGLTLYIGDDATAVKLHRPPFRAKLSRLRRVLDRLEAKDAEPAYVYLDNVRREDRVTVRLR